MPHEPFEQLYARAGADLTQLPWANLAPDRYLVAWLDSADAPAPGRTCPNEEVFHAGRGRCQS